jgi:Spy/CpxP family protein refolding chaperone
MDFMKMMRSDMNRQYHMSENRIRYWAMWNGNGASTSMQPFVVDDGFKQGLGLSDEQRDQLKFMMFSQNGSMGHWYQPKAKVLPELAALMEEHSRLRELQRDDPYGEKLTGEVKQAIITNLGKSSAIYHSETQKDIENLLTPEQVQAVKEYELAMI